MRRAHAVGGGLDSSSFLRRRYQMNRRRNAITAMTTRAIHGRTPWAGDTAGLSGGTTTHVAVRGLGPSIVTRGTLDEDIEAPVQLAKRYVAPFTVTRSG